MKGIEAYDIAIAENKKLMSQLIDMLLEHIDKELLKIYQSSQI